MAYYSIYPEMDTTLYSHPDRSEMNTGNDEILEIVKERGTTNDLLYPARILIKFKNEEIKEAISNIVGHTSFNTLTTTASLELTSAEPKNLLTTLNLNAFAISQSWDEGTGRYSNLPTSSNGASWKYRNNTTTATAWTTTGFAAATTGSISSSTTAAITAGGGVWYTGSNFRSSQQFLAGDSLDTNFDVTSIIQKWSSSLFNSSPYPTGINNHGFLIKKPENIETNVSFSFGELSYFSVDTHTIHPPKLTFKWDDSIYPNDYTASAKSPTEDLNVTLYKNQEEYNRNDVALFRIHVRDNYPTRQFASSSNYLNIGYLPTSSYYSIRDAHTEQEIIPFDDDNTKLSADDDGMNFKIYMKGLQPERYYRILIKHVDGSMTKIYDDKYYFKVIR